MSRHIPRKTVTTSVTTLFLLTGVCATLLAMATVPFRGVATVDSPEDNLSPIFVLLPIAGLLFGYTRFDRFRYIAFGGVFGFVLSIPLMFIATVPKGNAAELTMASLVGIIGLLAFQVFIRYSRRKK
jgi:hypothetical protein